MRTDSSSNTVVPASAADEAPSPATEARNTCRRYTGRSERGTNSSRFGEYDPLTEWTPFASATLPENTHAGSGAFESALPASMSSLIHEATSAQPADCQISNGPVLQPKPQRSARSTSRALSAIVARWTAE
jgi:hypothetical protein